jgi:lysine 6-dehydrogenase
MRIIVLGGAGDMGQRAVRTLACYPDVEQVTIADLNLSRAEVLAAELGGPPRFRAIRVDATSRESLVEAIRGHDAAASAIGPFYKFEVPVARAAIAAGVDYVSLCDDFDAARAVFDLDDEARAAGVRVMTGMGWTPGITNVVARRGADWMGEPESIDIAWAGSASDSKGYAVVLHTIHIFTGMVPSYQEGRLVEVLAGTGEQRLDFPPPLGEVAVFHVGHPEPVTIPRYFPGIRRVTLRGGLTEPFLNRLGLLLARLGLTASTQKKDVLGRLIFRVLPYLERLGPKGVPLSGLRVEVRGRKEGRPARALFRAADHMENLTGIPLAIGAWMLARGEVGAPPGVLAPEAPGAIDTGRFLAELGARGLHVEEQYDEGPAPV